MNNKHYIIYLKIKIEKYAIYKMKYQNKNINIINKQLTIYFQKKIFYNTI